MKILAVVLVGLVVAAVGCGSDPDAASRDRAYGEAKAIAESMELPAGYEVVEIKVQGAQTPKENRGGGQGGQIILTFEPSGRVAPSEVLADFDALLTGQGMVRSSWTGGSNKCTQEQVHMKWADSEKVVVLQYWVDGSHYVLIPYGYSGIVTAKYLSVETGVALPECTVG